MEQPPKADRYKSLLVDFIIILILMFLLITKASFQLKFYASFIPLVYFPILHTLMSRSIGDIIFNLKIVDQQGNKIGFQQAFNRFFWVVKYFLFSLFLTNILFLFFIFSQGQKRDLSVDYEGESGTYLVKGS